MPRAVYHIVYMQAEKNWHVQEGGKSLAEFSSREAAIREGKVRGHMNQRTGRRSYIRVQRPDGSLEVEYQYGPDRQP